MYHYDAINATRVYGVIGELVSPASALIHNAAFREIGFNCVYVPFHADRLASFSTASRRFRFTVTA